MPPTRFAGIKTINASGVQVIAQDSPVLMDGGISIGQLPIPLNNAIVLVNAAITDNNAGQANAPDISINVAAGQTAVIPIVVSEYLKQVNAFLSTLSVPAIGNDGKLADGSGDSPITKGTKVTGFEFCYSVQGGPLTSLAFRADLVTYSNQAGVIANTNTPIVANTLMANAFLANTANATTCRNAVFNVAAPTFDINDASTLYCKISPVTPGGCTFRLYAFMVNLTFNFN